MSEVILVRKSGTTSPSEYVPLTVDANTGALSFSLPPATTAAAPAVQTPDVTNKQLIAANTGRRVGIVQNRSGAEVFLRFGGTAATTASGGYHMVVANGATYELPRGLCTAIQIIAAALGTGPVIFTEITD